MKNFVNCFIPPLFQNRVSILTPFAMKYITSTNLPFIEKKAKLLYQGNHLLCFHSTTVSEMRREKQGKRGAKFARVINVEHPTYNVKSLRILVFRVLKKSSDIEAN